MMSNRKLILKKKIRLHGLAKNESFLHFKMAFGDFDTEFLRSKITGRWWMQLPDGKFIPCSYRDYMLASQNELPERYLRAVERS